MYSVDTVNAMQDSRYRVLTLLEQEGPMAASAIAVHCKARREAVSMLLMRARQDGLALFDRRRGLHFLSQRGRDRLTWLRERAGGQLT